MTRSEPVHGIVGLGNPGKEYQDTRHNIGFKIIDVLAKRHDVKLKRKWRFKGRAGLAAIEGKKTLLFEPLTYMNLSGRAVQPALNYYGIEPVNLIVVVDDVNLDPGMVRIRSKGSAGGHNGLKSIISALGTEDFSRIRIGVGAKQAGSLKGHVLGRFTRNEKELIEAVIEQAADAVEKILKEGVSTAMNLYNKKKQNNNGK
jgi:peptidyl-tRNA hydrolase, PTH1 family